MEETNKRTDQSRYVLIYHDVKDSPEFFDTIQEAEEYKKIELEFGSYDMDVIPIEDFEK